MPFIPAEAHNGRNISAQKLDASRLSGQHEWDLDRQTDISFRYVVEENPEPRVDAQRFKKLASVSLQAAQVAFAKMCRSSTLFAVPATIQCDRTFARDAEEAHYLDDMDRYLGAPPGPLRVEDLPILRSPLRSRYFCGFARRPLYYNEFYERRRTGRWIPGDSPDIPYFSDTELASWFPRVEEWLHEISQPTALPVPLPPALYYYHSELRDAEENPILMETMRMKRLRFCAREEFYILFLAMWWNDVYYGGKAFVLTPHTVEVLNEHCGTLPNIAYKPAQAIIERMRMFGDMPHRFHNWMCFNDRSLENAPFIFAVREIGTHDHTIQSGRRLWCRRVHRSVTTTRFAGNTFKRISLLEQRVTVPDLDEVPGMIALLSNQRWTEYNSLRVGDLLGRMLGLYKSTIAELRDCEIRLSREKRENDYARCRAREMEGQIHAMREELQDKNRRLDEAERTVHDLKQRLDSSRKEVARLDRESSEKSHRLIATQQRLREQYYQSPILSRNQILRSTSQANNTGGAPGTPTSHRQHAPIRDNTECISPSYSPVRTGSSGNGGNEAAASPLPAATNAQHEKLPLRKVKPGYTFHDIPRSQKTSLPATPSNVNQSGANGNSETSAQS